MAGYLAITIFVFVLCMVFSTGVYLADPSDKPLARKVARLSILSPLWPIGLVCVVMYGIYKFFTKIVFYKEK